ncbi:MAG: tripartite tricarboxylate transporter permease [Rhizobiaceae bacterium]|nr:tripartite tricarboxylate transporter permease [Rhizobiaceae bacterium]
MEVLNNLALGFSVAFGAMNLIYCFVGVLLGTFIGVLPGVGPLVTIAVLLPLTYGLPADGSLIMLAGIYYGAAYGGSTTAILVNLPGESSSVVTCIDGYQMARQGRAGAALAVAALASFAAGTFGTVLIALVGPPLTEVALKFGSAEYFSLMLMGLVLAAALVHGSVLKALGMIFIGVLIGLIGTDVNSGALRFTFGLPGLMDGLDFVIVAMGVFAFVEIITSLESEEHRDVLAGKIKNLMPSLDDLRRSVMPVVRGTAIGTFFGILPGAGATISSFTSYMVEKRVSRDPSRFGKGAVEGVAGPEAANNASAQTSFIPLLTLGIPGGATMALMLGALMIQGITPGPEMMVKQPDLFWGLIASMWIGNLMLVVLNLPLIGIWVSMLKVPYRWLYPGILVLSCIGIYTLANRQLDVFLAALFGLFGYILVKLDCGLAPLILGVVLGPMVEENFRRAMVISRGNLAVFVERPISAVFLVFTAIIIATMLIPAVRKQKERAAAEAE